MRTIAPVLLVLAIGVSAGMLGATGFADAWGAEPPQSEAAQEELNDSAADVNPNNKPVEGPVSSGDSEIVGIIANGIDSIVHAAAAVVLLQATLMQYGFPAWFAIPIGTLAQVVVGWGIIEFATNREWT